MMDLLKSNGERRKRRQQQVTTTLPLFLTLLCTYNSHVAAIDSSTSSSSSCADNPMNYSTALLITHLGILDNLDSVQVDTFEQLLRDVYHNKNQDLCDVMVRRITTIQADPTSTTLVKFSTASSSTNNNNDLDRFRIRYDIDGYCNNCLSSEGVVNQYYNNEGPLFGRTVGSRYNNVDIVDPLLCRCDQSNAPGRGPNEMEITNALNFAISTQSNPSSIQSIEEIMEVRAYECSSSNTGENNFRFRSYIRFEVQGDLYHSLVTDTTNTNNEEQRRRTSLEELVMDTYNELIFVLCDYPHFRSIVQVELVDMEYHDYVLGNETVLLFEIVAECHGSHHDCTENMNIFHRSDFVQAGGGGRLLFDDAELWQLLLWQEGATGNSAASSSGSCYCPANIPAYLSYFRSPTNHEFLYALNQNYQSLLADHNNEEWSSSSSSSKSSFDSYSFRSVMEVDRFHCGSGTNNDDQEDFTAIDFIQFQGTQLGLITQEEWTSMEMLFLEILSEEYFSNCDVYWRRLSQVRILPDEIKFRALQQEQQQRRRLLRRSLQQQQEQQQQGEGFDTPDAETDMDLPAVLEAKGTCRNCPVTDGTSSSGSFGLYDDSFERRELRQDIFDVSSLSAFTESNGGGVARNNNNVHRQLQQHLSWSSSPSSSSSCICPAGSVPTTDTSISKSNVIQIANNILETLKENGIVTHIDHITASPVRVRCSSEPEEETKTILHDAFEVEYDVLPGTTTTAVGRKRNPNERVEDIFVDFFTTSYHEQQSSLCDPFRRSIVDLSCVPIIASSSDNVNNNNVVVNKMGCNVAFECVGHCEEWIFPEDHVSIALFDNHVAASSFQFATFNCTCPNDGSPARAPTDFEVLERIAQTQQEYALSAASSGIITNNNETTTSAAMSYSFRTALVPSTPNNIPMQAAVSRVQFTIYFYFDHYRHRARRKQRQRRQQRRQLKRGKGKQDYNTNMFNPSEEEYQGMMDMISEFFFDSLNNDFNNNDYQTSTVTTYGSSVTNYGGRTNTRTTTLAYFLPSLQNTTTDDYEEMVEINLDALVEFTVGSIVPPSDDILNTMYNADMTDFLNNYLLHAEPQDENVFHTVEWVSFWR